LFPGKDGVLDLIGELIVIHIVSGNFIAGLHVEIIQHVGRFTNGVRETKMSM